MAFESTKSFNANNRQFDPQLAQAINATAQQGVTREGMIKAGLDPDKNDPHDPHVAAAAVLVANGMSPLDANTWWSYNQGAYQKNKEGTGFEEHKSAIDNPWIKAAVMAPMIIGGSFAVAGALGVGAGAASGAGDVGTGVGSGVADVSGEAAATGAGTAAETAGTAAGTTAAETGGDLAQTGGVAGDEFGGYSGAGEGTAGTGDNAGGWRDWLHGHKDLLEAGTGALGLILGGGLKDPYKGSVANLEQTAQESRDYSKNLAEAGSELVNPVTQYYKALISGDRTALMAATQPERRKVIDQYSTAKNSIANFAPRGGGQSSALINLEGNQAADLSGITAGVRANAAKEAGGLGLNIQGQGLESERTAVGAMGTELRAKEQQQKQKGDTGTAWGKIAGGVLTGLGYI